MDGRIDPASRFIGVVLELPDRYPLLYLLDDIPNRIESWSAVRMRGGNPDADVAEGESSDSMLHDQIVHSEPLTRLGYNALELGFSHRPVRRVIDPFDLPAVVGVTNGSQEEAHRSSVGPRYL